MATPLFVANGSSVATVTTTLALVAPASGVAGVLPGDCLVAVVATNDNTTPSGFDARFVSIASITSTASLQTSVYVLPDLAAADGGATFNFTIAGTTVGFGQLSVYRGARLTQVSNGSTSANASSATVTWGTFTPTNDSSIVVAAFGYALNGVTDSGISAGTPTMVNRYISTTATGGTESIGLYDGFTKAGVAFGSRTMATGATAAVNVGIAFELFGVGSEDQGGGNPGQGSNRYPSLIRTRSDGRIAGAPPPY